MQRKIALKSPLCRENIDALWMHAAGQLGFVVTRTDAAYATFNGETVIAIGVPNTLDHDDCVAQLVLHELCHALVEGPTALTQIDWGLDNTSDVQASREYAALRLQAHLADAHGLRDVMAPTTQWRPYYETLPTSALQGVDEAAALARQTIKSPLFARWFPVLDATVNATALALLHAEVGYEIHETPLIVGERA